MAQIFSLDTATLTAHLITLSHLTLEQRFQTLVILLYVLWVEGQQQKVEQVLHTTG